MLAAGDTFRAGAIEQLQVWGDRVGVEVIRQSEGSDPAAVVYDAINAAKNKGVDILICDTAGRLQNKSNLMQELDKMKRVISRAVPDAPHEALLCLDATTGQNALSQARSFKEVTNVSGIVLTKLDGTAKGGIVLAIRNELHIPVKYVGLGEKLDDLQPFNPESYVYGLFADMIEQNDNIPDEMQSLTDNNEEHQNGENDLVKTLRMNYLFDFYHSLLTENKKNYLELFYLNDYSLSEIAETFKVSRQAVYDNIRRTGDLVEDYETKLKLYEKFEQRQMIYNEMKQSIHDTKN